MIILNGTGVTPRIGRIQVQPPLGAQVGYGIQPCYEAFGDIRVKSRINRSD